MFEIPETHKNFSGFVEKFSWTDDDRFIAQWEPVLGWLGGQDFAEDGSNIVDVLKTYTIFGIPAESLVKDKTEVSTVLNNNEILNTKYNERVDSIQWQFLHRTSGKVIRLGVKYIVVDDVILKFD